MKLVGAEVEERRFPKISIQVGEDGTRVGYVF